LRFNGYTLFNGLLEDCHELEALGITAPKDSVGFESIYDEIERMDDAEHVQQVQVAAAAAVRAGEQALEADVKRQRRVWLPDADGEEVAAVETGIDTWLGL
jgi:hypothetical protein